MASMTIDKDVRTALDAGRITWAEAGQIMSLRREGRRLDRKMAPHREALDALEAEYVRVATALGVLVAKMDGVS